MPLTKSHDGLNRPFFTAAYIACVCLPFLLFCPLSFSSFYFPSFCVFSSPQVLQDLAVVLKQPGVFSLAMFLLALVV